MTNYIALDHINKVAYELGEGRWKSLTQHPTIVNYLVTDEHMPITVAAALFNKPYENLTTIQKGTVDSTVLKLSLFQINEVYTLQTARTKFPLYVLIGSLDEDRHAYFMQNPGTFLNPPAPPLQLVPPESPH